jgi:DNA-binding LytR/AlgR family response regulator
MGTPQGAVASPLLANVYLHYVFDLWVRRWRRQECYLVRTTIARVEAALPKQDFIRIHRSTLVNLARVHRMHPPANGQHDRILRDGSTLRLARSHRKRFLNRLTRIGSGEG